MLGQGGPEWRLGATAYMAYTRNLSTEHLGGVQKLMASGPRGREKSKQGLFPHPTSTRLLPSDPKAQGREGERGREERTASDFLIVTLLIHKYVFNPQKSHQTLLTLDQFATSLALCPSRSG